MSKRMHSHSIAWRKLVIDKAIIVLGALIALLELIRFLLFKEIVRPALLAWMQSRRVTSVALGMGKFPVWLCIQQA